MKKGFKILFAGILCIVLSVSFMTVSGFSRDCKKVREGVLRLHIIARSDSEEDQALKLRVRDRILLETGDLFSRCQNKEDCIGAAKENMDRIIACAKEEAAGYPVTGEVVNMYFSTRVYDDVTLPAGRYDAVRIVIGEGQGHNWWCVLFPGLCLPGCRVSDESREMLSPVNNSISGYKIKFWTVEIIEKIKEFFS